MKNNCDVSGSFAKCKGLYCEYFVAWKNKLKIRDCVYRNEKDECSSLAAIRAAIEAEQEDQLSSLKEENDLLREHAESQAERIDELPELWAETAKLKHDLATLKKDARLLATWDGNKDGINDAIARILEATKEKP